jgi:transposase
MSMLGQRNPQRSLFQVPFWAHGLINPDSFHARMGAFWSRVSHDEDLAAMYDEGRGRRSIPPSLLSGALILQYFDDVSDREAADRVRFDLRWKLALDLPLDEQGFDYSSLSRFRSRLAEHGEERYAFDKLLELAIAAGFLRRDAEQVLDSTPMHGAAALQDTYTLLRNGLRKLLLAMGESDPERRRLAKRLKLSEYLLNRKPELDWGDPEARKAHLQELVADAERLLAEADGAELPEGSQAQGAFILLEQLLGQDITRETDGQHAIRRGVAEDRVISTVDPEMRHGRKSSSTRFDGYKGHVAADPESELVTEVTVTPANTYDGQVVEELLDAGETHHDLQPSAVVGDQSVIDAERRHALAERGIEAVGKVTPRRPGGRYAKADFAVDLEAGTVTCPAGHTETESRQRTDAAGRVWRVFTFPREVCAGCPRRAQCTTATRTGRTISLHPYEELLQEAMVKQQRPGFRERYHRARSTVERVISHLVRHGFRQGRYFGRAKTLFQALWAAAAVNLQRLMELMSTRDGAGAVGMPA